MRDHLLGERVESLREKNDRPQTPAPPHLNSPLPLPYSPLLAPAIRSMVPRRNPAYKAIIKRLIIQQFPPHNIRYLTWTGPRAKKGSKAEQKSTDPHAKII